MTPADLPPNMASKIAEDERGCWIWSGARTGNGYGSVGIDGRQQSPQVRAAMRDWPT